MPPSPPAHHHRIVVGYHGCDRSVLTNVLNGESLRPSDNPWDWLGKGVYFWEYGLHRALDFAQEQQARAQSSVKEPAVLGAYINLGRCFDLTDVEHTCLLTEAFEAWKKSFDDSDVPMPANKRAGQQGSQDLLLRYRDCALLNWYMERLDASVREPYDYQSVRGVFVEVHRTTMDRGPMEPRRTAEVLDLFPDLNLRRSTPGVCDGAARIRDTRRPWAGPPPHRPTASHP